MTLALLWQLMRAYTLSMLSRLLDTASSDKSVCMVSKRSSSRPNSGLTAVNKFSPIAEEDIIAWVNQKLRNANKPTQLSVNQGFHDPQITDGLLIIHLIDAIRPGSVNYDTVYPGKTIEVHTIIHIGRHDTALVSRHASLTEGPLPPSLRLINQEKLNNAKYAVPLARRIGATVYAVPEDIVELKAKMILTIFACLMTVDLSENKRKMDEKHVSSVINTERSDMNVIEQMKVDNRQPECNDSYVGNSAPVQTETKTHPVSSYRHVEETGNSTLAFNRQIHFKDMKSMPTIPITYIKTFSVTIDKPKIRSRGVSSTFYTQSGPAGDGPATHVSRPHGRSESARRVERTASKGYRFLSPETYTGSRMNSRERQDGDMWSEKTVKLLHSIPSIDVLPDRNNKQPRDYRAIHEDESQEKNSFSNTKYCSNKHYSQDKQQWCYKEESRFTAGHRGFPSCAPLIEVQPKNPPVWPRRHHGGGRLFLATEQSRGNV